jgi:hypothetical protein
VDDWVVGACAVMFGWDIEERFIDFLESLVEVFQRGDVVSLVFGCLFVLLGFVGVLLNAEGLISRLLSDLLYCDNCGSEAHF